MLLGFKLRLFYWAMKFACLKIFLFGIIFVTMIVGLPIEILRLRGEARSIVNHYGSKILETSPYASYGRMHGTRMELLALVQKEIAPKERMVFLETQGIVSKSISNKANIAEFVSKMDTLAMNYNIMFVKLERFIRTIDEAPLSPPQKVEFDQNIFRKLLDTCNFFVKIYEDLNTALAAESYSKMLSKINEPFELLQKFDHNAFLNLIQSIEINKEGRIASQRLSNLSFMLVMIKNFCREKFSNINKHDEFYMLIRCFSKNLVAKSI